MGWYGKLLDYLNMDKPTFDGYSRIKQKWILFLYWMCGIDSIESGCYKKTGCPAF